MLGIDAGVWQWRQAAKDLGAGPIAGTENKQNAARRFAVVAAEGFQLGDGGTYITSQKEPKVTSFVAELPPAATVRKSRTVEGG